MATQGKHKFDFVPVNPERDRVTPITDGVAVGTIRTRWSKLPPTYRIACEHCGHEDSRTEWQAQNQFKCYECHRMSRGLTPRGLPMEPAEVK